MQNGLENACPSKPNGSLASNLYELGANDKIVQRILRHAKPHVTKERYIKAFDSAVLEAMPRMQATLDVLEKSPATGAIESGTQ